MKDILSKCHDFNFSESYAFADKVRKAIFENDYFIVEKLDTPNILTNGIVFDAVLAIPK